MRKNEKRAKKRKAKYPQRKVTTTTNPQEREAFYAQTDREAPLGKYQLAAGAIQHPRTGMWQVWVSTNGLDINHLSAHHEKAGAEANVESFKRFAATDDVYDPEKCAALFHELEQAGDAKPEPLPDATVKTIARDILHMVIDLKEPKR